MHKRDDKAEPLLIEEFSMLNAPPGCQYKWLVIITMETELRNVTLALCGPRFV